MHTPSPLFSTEPNYTLEPVDTGHSSLKVQEINSSRKMGKHTKIPSTTELVVSLVFSLWCLLALAQGSIKTGNARSVQTEKLQETPSSFSLQSREGNFLFVCLGFLFVYLDFYVPLFFGEEGNS